MAKAIKKQVLGRGLAALLQDSKTEESKEESLIYRSQVGTIVELELGLIEYNWSNIYIFSIIFYNYRN